MKKILCWLFLLFLCTSCFLGTAKKRVYTIVRANKIEGINLQGKENSIQGFIDDILYEIAAASDIRIKINTVDHGYTADLLALPGTDAVMGVIDATIKNQKNYDVSDPVFTFGPVVVMRIHDTYKDLDSLKDKIVGFDRAYAGLVQNREDLSFILKPYDQMTYAMEDLVNGKIDAIILDSIRAYQFVGNFYANKLKVASSPLIVTNLCLIVNHGQNDELIIIFNQGLRRLKANGTYQKMLDYWGLFDPAYNKESGVLSR